MKELKSLNRTMALLEAAHLCLLCWCLSLTLLFLVPEYPPRTELLWALGAALPTLAVWGICLAPLGLPVRAALCLGVCGLCMLLPTGILRLCWILCAGIPAFAGCVLRRPAGKMVLTVPRPWHALAFLSCFGMARFVGGAVPKTASAAFALLFLLNSLLYLHTKRLRSLLCDPGIEALSAGRMVRTGRVMVLGFLLLAAAALIAIPLLTSAPDQRSSIRPSGEPGVVPTAENGPETVQLPEGIVTPDVGSKSDSGLANRIVARIFEIFLLASVGICLIALIIRLCAIENGSDRKTAPKESGLTVEDLPPEPSAPALREPPAEGWERKIRRRYAALIGSRAGKGVQLSPLTPTQLEQAAGLPEGEALDTLHTLYEKARYGSEACSRADEAAVKAAIRRLRRED